MVVAEAGEGRPEIMSAAQKQGAKKGVRKRLLLLLYRRHHHCCVPEGPCCLVVIIITAVVAAGWTLPVAGEKSINIALHAQSNYATHGWVAGGSVPLGRVRRRHVFTDIFFSDFLGISVDYFFLRKIF